MTAEQQAVIDAAIALIEKASESAGCDITQRDLLPLAKAVAAITPALLPVPTCYHTSTCGLGPLHEGPCEP